MLSEKEKDEILRLRQEENLSYKEIHKKTKFSINTIMNVCREKAEESQKEEAKKQVVSQDGEEIDKDKNQIKQKEEVIFNSAEDKIRAMPGAIDDFIETEHLKGASRAEWEKRKEEIKEILRIEVDDRIADEREDATEISDGQWRVLIKKEFDKKEVAANLRRVLKERDTTIEDLGNDNVALWETNADLTKENEEKDNLNTNLNNKNADLNDYIENYLDDAGRRERSKLRLEKESFAREKTDFDSACVREQNKLEQERDDFDQSVNRIGNYLTKQKSKLDQRDKDQNNRDKELDERKKLIEGQADKQQIEGEKIIQDRDRVQKLLDDQVVKQQIEREKIIQDRDRVQKLLDDQVVKQQKKATELKQKEYELEQKRDAIATVKKDLMDFAEEIGHEFLELGRVEQKIERNKHFLLLTGEREKVLERIPLS